MIKYIIIVVVALFLLLIAAFVVRRKHNAEIARLEKEKVELRHYPIFEELTKVKMLNMNGQTEELFEMWRSKWTEVMDVYIVKMDAMLFDAEEHLDRFRFKKATQIEKNIQASLIECEEIRKEILSELDELIGSEEKNRIEMEQLKEYYRSARKTVLAHQHSFGNALPKLEERIEQFAPQFEQFDELTSNGNYLQAREMVLKLNAEAQTIFDLLSNIPTVLADLQTKIPGSIHELRNGQREMEEQNYYLGHLEMDKFLANLESELDELREMLADLQLEKVQERVQDIHDEIDMIYDQLEKEVYAKAFVDKNAQPVLGALMETMRFTQDIFDETAYVQHSYRLAEADASIPREGLKKLQTIQKRYDLLASRLSEEKSAASSLQTELEQMMDEIERVKEVQEEFSSSLKNLRIDEVKARGELQQLRKQLQNTERQLQKANIPGVPEDMDARLEEAEEQIFVVMQSMEEVPLNMPQVNSHLAIATKAVQDVTERAEEMIENVLLIERLIQYGNRYRQTNPAMHAKLLEAEDAFRQFRYVKALEDAAVAVESVDPSALQQIEQLVQEELAIKS